MSVRMLCLYRLIKRWNWTSDDTRDLKKVNIERFSFAKIDNVRVMKESIQMNSQLRTTIHKTIFTCPGGAPLSNLIGLYGVDTLSKGEWAEGRVDTDALVIVILAIAKKYPHYLSLSSFTDK